MRLNFLVVGPQHRQVKAAQIHRHNGSNIALCRRIGLDQQGILAAREVDVDVGQQFGIQQGAVQGAARVVDAQAGAQGVELNCACPETAPWPWPVCR
jgi:hypothetical protein